MASLAGELYQARALPVLSNAITTMPFGGLALESLSLTAANDIVEATPERRKRFRNLLCVLLKRRRGRLPLFPRKASGSSLRRSTIFGEHSVARGVAGRARLAFGRGGAARVRAIGARRGDAFFRNHIDALDGPDTPRADARGGRRAPLNRGRSEPGNNSS